MSIQASEISSILKDQIKNLGKKPKLRKLVVYYLWGTELLGSMALITFRLGNG